MNLKPKTMKLSDKLMLRFCQKMITYFDRKRFDLYPERTDPLEGKKYVIYNLQIIVLRRVVNYIEFKYEPETKD